MGQLVAETCRLELLTGIDRLFRDYGFQACAGVDEAGRGALAGPVVAAAVVIDPETPLPGVDDSKALDATRRGRLASRIRHAARSWAAIAVGPAEIERVNILEATRMAMHSALERLDSDPDCALVDAVKLTPGIPSVGLVRGDAVCYSVACASILAKDERDRRMIELDRRYPQYGFARHKGYAAAEHLEALERYGPCPQHRLTFRSVVPRDGEVH